MKPQTQKSPQKAFTQGERHLSTWEIYFELGKKVHEFQGVWGVSKLSLELSIKLPEFRLFGQIHNSTWQAFLIDVIELE